MYEPKIATVSCLEYTCYSAHCATDTEAHYLRKLTHNYTGETGRNLNVQLSELKRATINGDINNPIAEHYLQTNHTINLDSAKCVTYSHRLLSTNHSWNLVY